MLLTADQTASSEVLPAGQLPASKLTYLLNFHSQRRLDSKACKSGSSQSIVCAVCWISNLNSILKLLKVLMWVRDRWGLTQQWSLGQKVLMVHTELIGMGITDIGTCGAYLSAARPSALVRRKFAIYCKSTLLEMFLKEAAIP